MNPAKPSMHETQLIQRYLELNAMISGVELMNVLGLSLEGLEKGFRAKRASPLQK